MLEHNLDGTSTEHFPVEPTEERLLALLRAVFEEHWQEVVFGPCIQGAVFGARFTTPPHLRLLDGYVTVGGGADQPWHLHLCIGPHRGTPARPTPPELAVWRRCARAAFFRDRDRDDRPAVSGFRMWNGRGEQMITIFFPNPWLERETMRPVRVADWSRLGAWMALRERFAGLPGESPPVDVTPPALH
jgi:hypothetical protein